MIHIPMMKPNQGGAIELVSYNEQNGTTNSYSHLLTTGVSDGDALLLFVTSRTTTGTISATGGWTQILSYSANNLAVAVFFKIASSEPSSYSVTIPNTRYVGQMVAYRNVDTAATLDTYSGVYRSAVNQYWPNVSSSKDGNMLVLGLHPAQNGLSETEFLSPIITNITWINGSFVAQGVYGDYINLGETTSGVYWHDDVTVSQSYLTAIILNSY